MSVEQQLGIGDFSFLVKNFLHQNKGLSYGEFIEKFKEFLDSKDIKFDLIYREADLKKGEIEPGWTFNFFKIVLASGIIAIVSNDENADDKDYIKDKKALEDGLFLTFLNPANSNIPNNEDLGDLGSLKENNPDGMRKGLGPVNFIYRKVSMGGNTSYGTLADFKFSLKTGDIYSRSLAFGNKSIFGFYNRNKNYIDVNKNAYTINKSSIGVPDEDGKIEVFTYISDGMREEISLKSLDIYAEYLHLLSKDFEYSDSYYKRIEALKPESRTDTEKEFLKSAEEYRRVISAIGADGAVWCEKFYEKVLKTTDIKYVSDFYTVLKDLFKINRNIDDNKHMNPEKYNGLKKNYLEVLLNNYNSEDRIEISLFKGGCFDACKKYLLKCIEKEDFLNFNMFLHTFNFNNNDHLYTKNIENDFYEAFKIDLDLGDYIKKYYEKIYIEYQNNRLELLKNLNVDNAQETAGKLSGLKEEYFKMVEPKLPQISNEAEASEVSEIPEERLDVEALSTVKEMQRDIESADEEKIDKALVEKGKENPAFLNNLKGKQK